jgi:hypothetical protein
VPDPDLAGRSESESEEMEMEGEGGEGIVGDRLGLIPTPGVRRKIRDEDVASSKWLACSIDEWHVIVWTRF